MLVPGQPVGRYIVEELLGEGGMAQVFRVRHSALDTLHALKVLTLRRSDVQARFLQEGRVQANLRHPNILAVHDVLEFDGNTALLLEYVDGPTLDQWLDEAPPSFDEVERIFREIVAGVRAAHQAGLVHRDLKPANVLLARTEDGVTAKVADFGLAKITGDASSGATRSGIAMGTPAYMSPEQFRDAKRVDRRADVYALGCMLYEMLARRPPFESEDMVELIESICGGQYAPLDTLVPDLPPRFALAARDAMLVDADRRLPDCDSLLEVLTTGERTVDETAATQLDIPVVSILPALSKPSDAPAKAAPSSAVSRQPASAAGATYDGVAATPAPRATGAAGATEAGPEPGQRQGAGAVLAGATLAATGVVALAVAVVLVAVGGGLAWFYGTPSEAPPETSVVAPTADVAPSAAVPDCAPGESGRIGWIKVEGKSFPYTTTWSPGRPRSVYADLPSDANGWNAAVSPVCTLAGDTTIRLSEKQQLAGTWWVALDADAFGTSAPVERSPSPRSTSGTRPSTSTRTPSTTAPKTTTPKTTTPSTPKKPSRNPSTSPLDRVEQGIEDLKQLEDQLPRRDRIADDG